VLIAMAQVLALHVFFSAEIHKVGPSKPLKRIHKPKTSLSTRRKGKLSITFFLVAKKIQEKSFQLFVLFKHPISEILNQAYATI